MGDPTRPDTQMGPLITAKHRESVERYVALGLEGGRLLCGGERPAGDEREDGFFYQPTILEGLPNSARICQEEIFGPVLVAMPFDDEASLIAQANDSVFGGRHLDARLQARMAHRTCAGDGHRLDQHVQAVFDLHAVLGLEGERDGAREGRLGIREYMQQKSLYWGLNDAPLPWAN